MAHDYSEKTKRSSTKDPEELNGAAIVRGATVQLSLPIAEILAGVEDSLESLAGQAGLLMIKALLNDEVDQKVGDRYVHAPGRKASRHGHENGFVVFGGRKVPVRRPRVRSLDGQEVPLERYELFQAGDRMEKAVARRVMRGVSTRNYRGVLDAMCEGYGIERSSVSRHWKAVSAKQMKELVERRLEDLDLIALMIDGVAFHETLVVVALGFSADGHKHVLGLWQGATENATVCTALFDDLIERGLRTDQRYLFVLDGSKALRKAVRAVFGDRAVVQRCVVHKERNLLSYLPEEYHRTVRQRLSAAWGMTDHDKARAALRKLVDYVGELSVSAQRSLEDGLDESLTLHRLGIPVRLRRALRTTNSIENCFSSTRQLCRNVRRWRNDAMTARWAGTMLLAAERKFRRVNAFREMPFLIASVRKATVDAKEIAA